MFRRWLIMPHSRLRARLQARFLARFLARLGLATSLLVLGACSRTVDPSAGVRFKIPWAQSDGNYQVQEVAVTSLHDLSHLQGDAADIRVDADVSANTFSGPLANFQFLQILTGKGFPVLVPEDTVSLEMAALYAQTEYIRKFDSAAGAEGWLTYPRKIALMDHGIVSDGNGAIENNAMYIGSSDTTIIVRYTLDQLPISLNAGIMAHEHFHSLFQHQVLDALGKTTDGSFRVYGERGVVPEPRGVIPPGGLPAIENALKTDPTKSDPTADKIETDLYNSVLLRGINEGFADVWGWLYSGQAKFIYNSLPGEAVRQVVNRSLNASAEPINGTNGLLNEVHRRLPRYKIESQKGRVMDELTAYSYWQGAHYARFIYALAKVQNGIAETSDAVAPEVRAQVAQNFLKILDVLRVKMLDANKNNSKLSVMLPLIESLKAIPSNVKLEHSDEACALLKHSQAIDLTDSEKESVLAICPEPIK